MSITINGTTGISGVDGSSTAPAFQGNDTNTGIFYPAADTIAFAEGGVESMRLDSNGNVGIGTTSPTNKLTIGGTNSNIFFKNADATTGYAAGQIANTGGSFYFGLTSSTGAFWQNTAGNYAATIGTSNATNLSFATNDNVRMLIDSSGNVGIGTTAPNAKLDIFSGNSNTLNITTNNTNTIIFNITRATVTTVTHTLDSTGYKIINGGSGGLYLGFTGTSWISLSDERFKTDLKPIENAVEKVSTLRAVTGRFKTDNENKSRAFLIAQDIQAVLPEAVDTSNPEQLGVSYTDTIPLLVAAIKEQQTIINDLKARVTALEASNV